MERLVYRVNLDAMRTGIQTTLQGFTKGESLDRSIRINLSAKGEAVYLGSDAVATMYVVKTKGGKPSVNGCEIEDNTIVYDILESDIDTAGMVRMTLKVVTSDKILIAPVFCLEVMDSDVDDSGAIASPTFTALDDAIRRANEVYNKRLVSVDFTDYVFYANYADGTSYSNDCFKVLLDVVTEAGDNELGRIQAEADRVQAEADRVQAELDRVNNELARIQAEADRAQAESDRVVAEANRVLAEADRVAQELARVASETTRESDYQALYGDMQALKTDSEALLDDLSDALDDARDVTARTEQIADSTEKLRDDIQALIDKGGVVTQTEKDNWNDAYAMRHVHSNKTILDDISSNDIDDWNDAVAMAHVHNNMDELESITTAKISEWDDKAEKSVTVSVIVPHSGWTGSDPAENVLTVSGVTSDSIVLGAVASSATSAEVETFCNALIATGTVGSGTVTLYAYGEVPAMDLPATFIVGGV